MELIDREAVREFIKSYSHSTDVAFDMEKHLGEIPTIDAVPVRHGEWIVHTEVKNIYGGICVECPVCGDHFVVLNVSDEKYCRSCGTKMDGGKRE